MEVVLMITRIKKIVKEQGHDMSLVLASWIIPKNKHQYVFTSGGGKSYNGSPKYLMEYMNPLEKCVFLVNDKGLMYELRLKGINARYTYSLSSWWATVRANSLIIDNGLRGIFGYGILARFGRFHIVQTWHGTGIKGKIQLHGLDKIISKWIQKSYSVILASSELHKEIMKKHFDTDNVVITGSPRNDLLINKTKWVDTIGLSKYDKVFLYAPTFRDRLHQTPFNMDFLTELNDWLKKMNYVFVLKRHPNDKTFPLSITENIIDISTHQDIQQVLPFVDVLITDYSSIITDFMLLERPVIIYPYDNEEYESVRPHYASLDTLPGPIVTNEKELFEMMKNEKYFKTRKYKEDYERSLELWNAYRDGKSCKRAYEIAKRKVTE